MGTAAVSSGHSFFKISMLFEQPASSSVCVLQVATGEEFVAVSALTLPSKAEWAQSYGYKVLEYVFEDLLEMLQCCADRPSFACTLTNVQLKYCATLDALQTGGEGAGVVGNDCSYVFLTDADAVLLPGAPNLDEFLLPATLVVSAGETTESATASTLETFNSGAMIWRNSEEAVTLVEAVLDFDDASFDGVGSCSFDVFGYGDQWALCGAIAKDPTLLLGVAAFAHPDKLQRCVLWLPGSTGPVPQTANDIAAQDWPPKQGEEAFVVNCAGANPTECVHFILSHGDTFAYSEEEAAAASAQIFLSR